MNLKTKTEILEYYEKNIQDMEDGVPMVIENDEQIIDGKIHIINGSIKADHWDIHPETSENPAQCRINFTVNLEIEYYDEDGNEIEKEYLNLNYEV